MQQNTKQKLTFLVVFRRIECGAKHVNRILNVLVLMPTEISNFILVVCFNMFIKSIACFIKFFVFLAPGSSSVPCSQTYSGPEPFSEPETKALANFVSTFNNIKVYLALHSYGQYLLHPYVSNMHIILNL